MFKPVLNFARNSSKPVKIIISSVLVLIIGTMDFYTSSEISFSIFYLIPISYAAWFIGRRYGFIFSVFSALLWLYMDILGETPYSNPAIPYWNALVRLGFFVIVTFLMSKIKSLQDSLEESIEQRTSDLLEEVNKHMNAREEIIRKTERLRELNKKIESIREEQNQRIAREVHDELGQLLTGINLEIMWIAKKHAQTPDIVERMGILSEIVTETIGTVRKISSDLRPRLLDQLGIFPAIESLLKEFQNRTSIKISLTLPQENIEIENTAATTIFRILQEALTNITRHAACTLVTVNVWKQGTKMLVMSIKDNGRGFDYSKISAEAKTLGLIGMRERANILNGSLDVLTVPGGGTEVVLEIPY